MKDFAVPAAGARPDARGLAERALVVHRLDELERRVGRVEAFILGVLYHRAVGTGRAGGAAEPAPPLTRGPPHVPDLCP